MNSYPIWWDSTITLYNKYIDPLTQETTWTRTVIGNCFWKNDSNNITVGDTVISASSTICRIPEQDNFLIRYDWCNKPSDQRGNYFTLGRGDIIIKGEVDDEIDERTKGHRATDLLNKYKDMLEYLEIEEFTIDTGAGRCNPHYYVRGK